MSRRKREREREKKKKGPGTTTTYHNIILSTKKTIIYLRDFIQTKRKKNE